MKRFLTTSAVLIGSLAVAAPVSHAGSYSAGDSSELQEKFSYRHEDCNQYCLYQKANETIGIQAIYLLQKLGNLKAGVAHMDEDEFRKQVPGFCLKGEAKDDCWKRYRDLQVVHLYKMRSAMIQNGEAAAQLSSNLENGKTRKNGATFYRPSSEGRKAKGDPSYVVTFEDLQKESTRLQFLSGNDFQRWASRLPREPSKDDFIRMKEIPRDPGNPEAGTFLIVDRDSDGKFRYDEKRYEAAVKGYREEMAQHYRRMGADMAMPADSAPKNFKAALGPNDKEYFRESRAQYVSSISSLAKAGGIQSTGEISFPGKEAKGRDPASGRRDTSGIAENQQPVRSEREKNTTHFRFGEFSPDQMLKAIDEIMK